MKVSKFGGSSQASEKSIENILLLAQDEERKCLVFSAIGKSCDSDEKVTDLLVEVYEKFVSTGVFDIKKVKSKFYWLRDTLSLKVDLEGEFEDVERKFKENLSYDYLLSRGEYLTAKLMSQKLGIKFVPSEQLLFFKNNLVDYKKTEKAISEALHDYDRIITGGFYGVDEKGDIKLLSRGGGDLSGAIFARVCMASVYEIFTDVDGIYQINPKIGKSKKLEFVSYKDLIFMTGKDAKVVQKDCGKVLKNTQVKLVVRNSFNLADQGTQISKDKLTDKAFISIDEKTGKIYLSFLGKRRVVKAYEKENLLKLL